MLHLEVRTCDECDPPIKMPLLLFINWWPQLCKGIWKTMQRSKTWARQWKFSDNRSEGGVIYSGQICSCYTDRFSWAFSPSTLASLFKLIPATLSVPCIAPIQTQHIKHVWPKSGALWETFLRITMVHFPALRHSWIIQKMSDEQWGKASIQ